MEDGPAVAQHHRSAREIQYCARTCSIIKAKTGDAKDDAGMNTSPNDSACTSLTGPPTTFYSSIYT